MAVVIRKQESGSVLDHNLERLLTFWRAVPEQAAEWPEWDDYSRVDFIHEWPVMRDILTRVSEAANAGRLDAGQLCKWTELNQLIDTHRATVEQMIEGPI
jgi:hypothetical protein